MNKLNKAKKIADECLGKQEIWKKEFEDIWGEWEVVGFDLNHYNVISLLITYLGIEDCNVKIKARKGKIVIERIK